MTSNHTGQEVIPKYVAEFASVFPVLVIHKNPSVLGNCDEGFSNCPASSLIWYLLSGQSPGQVVAVA